MLNMILEKKIVSDEILISETCHKVNVHIKTEHIYIMQFHLLINF